MATAVKIKGAFPAGLHHVKKIRFKRKKPMEVGSKNGGPEEEVVGAIAIEAAMDS